MKRKILSILAFLIFCIALQAQLCLPEGVIFRYQSEIDNFASYYPGCTEIEGNVIISGSGINNLDGLNVLTAIGGNLSIQTNFFLSNIDGLSNLTSISGNLVVRSNNKLKNLDGLNNLTYIGGGVGFIGNTHMETLPQWENLSSIGSNLSITGNTLVNLAGLESLTSIGGSLIIQKNSGLESLAGLENLAEIGESVYIGNNLDLTDITALENISSIAGGLSIESNFALSDLAGLNNLVSIGGNFSISNNHALTTLSDLAGLTFIGGGGEIISNNSLPNLAGLENIPSIGGGVSIRKNGSLTTLDGLSGLSSIGGYLVIGENALLTSLAGLENVISLGERLWIFDNPMLGDCAIYSVCNHLLYRIEDVTIQNNYSGCDTPEEVELACGGLPVLVTVAIDNTGECEIDASNAPVAGIQVRLSGNGQMVMRPTNADGIATFGFLDAGWFFLHLPQFPMDNWAVCQDTIWVAPGAAADTIRATFLLQPLNLCPELSAEAGLPPSPRDCPNDESPHFEQPLWVVRGNPFGDFVAFAATESMPGEKLFSLFNRAGRLVLTKRFSGQELEFYRLNLPDGMYFFRIADAQGRSFAGKIIAASD
jgi:hypothetical protein